MATMTNADFALWGAELLIWMEAHPVLVVMIIAALMAPGLICVVAARRGEAAARSGLHRIDERLGQIYRAVELLTDTTESAFGITFAEIERIAEETGVRAARRAQMPNRVATAARDGMSPREIALSEGVSEGEIRLRLQLLRASGASEADTAARPGDEIHGSNPAAAEAGQPYQTH
jgi:hypothetical protein